MIRVVAVPLLVLALASCTASPSALSVTGSGSGAVHGDVPTGAMRLTVTFWCSDGDSRVELRDAPGVFMAGECGGQSTYEMPLPDGKDSYTLDVTLDDGVEYPLTGEFGS